MHLVLPYHRPPHGDHELRFSLRAACTNLDVGSVTLLGDCPEWLRDVTHIPGGDDTRDKIANVLGKLRAWLPSAPEEFVWTNDDFFVLDPSIDLRPTPDAEKTIGFLAEKLRGAYRDAATATAGVVGQDTPAFELHKPMLMHRARVATVLQDERPIALRTTYGVATPPEERATAEPDRLASIPCDVAELIEGPWFASKDTMACDAAFIRRIKARFPEKCRFEAP